MEKTNIEAKLLEGFFDGWADTMQVFLEIAEGKRSIDDWNNEMNKAYKKLRSLLVDDQAKVLEAVSMEKQSVRELEPKMSEAMKDIASKVCFKEGYNSAVSDLEALISRLKEEK